MAVRSGTCARGLGCLVATAMLIGLASPARAQPVDPYEQYLKTSRDFRPVKQDKDWALKAWPSWTYMPWTFQWTAGYTDASGKWSVDHGYNGAFVDWDKINVGKDKTGRLDWIDRHKLRFYVDHLAGKRYLHLWDKAPVGDDLDRLHGTGVRTPPLNDATRDTLHAYIRKHVAAVKSSPNRAAYALDDEPSWGHFVHPSMWCVSDDPKAYPKWLDEVYGPGKAPKREKWISYEDLRTKVPTWSVKDFDASPLLDQFTFNDAHWANYLGDLVEFTNSIDPHTPVGLVGGQSPNVFGGYDYARLMRKLQFIEAYNLGSSQSVIRSFNPGGGLPTTTTHFHRDVDDTTWQVWYYLAHGNRGHIGWVKDWFDGETPKPWHKDVAPTYLEAGQKIGPLMSGADWIHDGVAIYYSHPSIQLGWVLDAQAHRKTWIRRNEDDRLGASHHVRHAWENMLRDSGIQYNFVSYVDVVQKGIPAEYKVLILPACLALSDAEVRQIKAFCERGGTVIADYLPAVWDQHGKGRAGGGALDDLFNVRHDPNLKAKDVFNGDGKLWCEVDQDANYSWKTYEEFLTKANTCLKDATGFHKAVREMPVSNVNRSGKGTAVLMNLSPQWYNAHRAAGFERARSREAFVKHVRAAGVNPWVTLKDAADREHGHEVTYFSQAGRTIVFVCNNPEITFTWTGGGNAAGLKSDVVPVTLRFADPVKGARDERSGKALGDGTEFKFDWRMSEAIVLSFDGPPPR